MHPTHKCSTAPDITIKLCTKTDALVLHYLWEFIMNKNMIVFCFRSSWKAKKRRASTSSCDCFGWTMTFRNNTAQYMLIVFYFRFLIWCWNKTKQTKKKETENVLSCLSLCFGLKHCGLFALMGAESETDPREWRGECTFDGVRASFVHPRGLTRPARDLRPSPVLFFFTVIVRSSSSHLVNSWNCLLPQKCFKFYIIVLMFYK